MAKGVVAVGLRWIARIKIHQVFAPVVLNPLCDSVDKITVRVNECEAAPIEGILQSHMLQQG
ncbi:MAG TPA: hypothetical protein VFA65_20425 [Bryobacteraceae bacterium]|nr:hypothetical protein [Bryobacteraceae bacterium]